MRTLCITVFCGAFTGHEHYTPKEGETREQQTVAIEAMVKEQYENDYSWLAYEDYPKGSHILDGKEILE
jgi:hypothetical protein